MGTKVNLLQATLEAILDSDNTIGGGLIAKIRLAAVPGRNDGTLANGSANLVSPVDVFSASWVGRLIDILRHGSSTNWGTYRVVTYVNPKTVTLQTVIGGAPAFANETAVMWRPADLQVQGLLGFPERDRQLQVFVGYEDLPTPYAQIDLTPLAQVIRGIGEQTYCDHGQISLSTPTHLLTRAPFWLAAHVGATVWVLPQDPTNGNEAQPRLVSSIVSPYEAVVSSAYTAAATWAVFMVKTYLDRGYPKLLHDPGVEVVEASRGFSVIDHLRRAMQVDYAIEDELDALGRGEGVDSLRGMNDFIRRRLIKAMAFLRRNIVYALELVLDALFPAGGWGIYEDRVNCPCEVFLTIPTMNQVAEYRGKTFLEAQENPSSTNTTHVTISNAPNKVESVCLQDLDQNTEMAVLPSADTPAWTYVNAGSVEGAVFSVSSSLLTHAQTGGTADGGRYKRTISRLPSEIVSLAAWFRVDATTAEGGHPWTLVICDGLREYALNWGGAELILGQSDGTIIAGIPWTPTTGKCYRMELRVEETEIVALINGAEQMRVPTAVFAASANKEVAFGYWNNAANQNWSVTWDRVSLHVEDRENFWNLKRGDGVLNAGDAHLTSASAVFLVAHEDHRVRIRGVLPLNDGLWLVHYVGAGDIVLDPILWGKTGTAEVENYATVTGKMVTVKSPMMRPVDEGKSLEIVGSTEGNDGTYPILEWIDAYTVRVDKTTDFANETSLQWNFLAAFAVETAISWEIVDAGTPTAAVLTLADALPDSISGVVARYTTVRSAEILANETVGNLGTAGHTYYPAYLADADADLRALITEDVLAAGVIPRFERDW
jgi:hypothetical protein